VPSVFRMNRLWFDIFVLRILLGRNCPIRSDPIAAQPSGPREARLRARRSRAQALTARTCDLRSHEFLFYGGSNALDKTGCSISRPYPDMRSWQRLGVKLRGQRNRRVSGTPSREARRNLPARRRRGTRDERVRPTHVNVLRCRNVRQAKSAERLEPKGRRQSMVISSLDHHG
jgi:hypothetical protein